MSNESEPNAQLVTMYSRNKTNEYTHLLVFCVVLKTAKPIHEDLDEGPNQESLSGDSGLDPGVSGDSSLGISNTAPVTYSNLQSLRLLSKERAVR